MLSHDLGKRIMFGTDQMQWPDAIGMAIEVIESAKSLTTEQRRDIFYNNAARFLRLTASDVRALPIYRFGPRSFRYATMSSTSPSVRVMNPPRVAEPTGSSASVKLKKR